MQRDLERLRTDAMRDDRWWQWVVLISQRKEAKNMEEPRETLTYDMRPKTLCPLTTSRSAVGLSDAEFVEQADD